MHRPELMFPIHPVDVRGYRQFPKSIPWSFVEPHEKQAQSNHAQTLARLAERGGLSWKELLAVTQDKRYSEISHVKTPEAAELVLAAIAKASQGGTE